ncbi:MAG: hypothetical protein U0V73_08555 [Acidimicrobiia bacterium]
MSAGDVAALVLAIAVAMTTGALVVVLVLLARSLRSLRAALAELQRESLASVREMHDAVRLAAGDLDRVDTLLATAESVTGRVDSASRFAYRAVSNPVVKTIAAGAGARKAVRRIRRPETTDTRK